MKIHLDYLEGRVEELENANMKLSNDKKQSAKKVAAVEDKLKSLTVEKDKELDKLRTELQHALDRAQATESKHRDQIAKLSRELEIARASQATIVH